MSSETNLQLFPGVFRSTVGGENPGFFLHSDGRVGIGNKAPTTRPLWSSDDADRNKLNVTGHTHIDGNLNVTGSVYGDGSNMTGVALPWVQSTPNVGTDIKYEGGNVGIGGAASTEALTVYGDLNLKSGGQLKFNGQTPVFSNWSVDGSDIYRSTGNVGIGGAASGTNKLKVHGTVEALSFSGIQATDVPTLNQDTTGNAGYADSCGNADTVENLDSSSFFRGDTTNDVDVRFAAVHGRGVRFWDSDSYKIYMSSATDGTWGGRLDGQSDYNMYFRMTSGTKRGFVFLNNRSVKCHINGSGDLYLNGGWLRTYGSRGWYSQTYGGGWFMQDTTYVRVHSNKVIYTGGSILAGGNVTAYSDIRRKKDLLKIDNALDKVEQLTGYTYTNKLDNKRYTGLIAQDVQKVLPEAVNTEELDGHLSLAYGNMMGLLVEAVKELTRKNEILEARLNVIENNR